LDPLIKSHQITLIYQAHFDISSVRSGIEPEGKLENVETRFEALSTTKNRRHPCPTRCRTLRGSPRWSRPRPVRIANTILRRRPQTVSPRLRPNDLLMLRHAGSDTDSLRAKLGTAASLTVKETGYGPQLQPWKPFSTLPVRARNAPDDRAATATACPSVDL
jgi:hypothetical protein